MRVKLGILAAISCLSFAVGADARFPHGNPDPSLNTIIPLKVGAGGFMTKCDIQCDQGVGACNNSGTTTKVCAADVMGAYIYNSSIPNPGNAGGTGAWQQLMTASRFPVTAGTPYQPDSFGVYDIRIAPSNTSHLYMLTNGFMYASTDKGASWTKLTNFAQVSANPNDQTGEAMGPFMAVDPKNENIVIAGTPTLARYTLDGGANWTQISGLCTPTIPISAGQGGGFIPVFDPSSGGTTSTPGVYITCYGTGIYHSSTGASGTFTSVGGANMPTTFTQARIDNSGNVYVIDDSSAGALGFLKKLSGGTTWSTVTTGLANQFAHRSIAIDPNSTHMLVVDNVGHTSFFNGTSWSADQAPTVVATDIPWLAHLFNNTFDGEAILFDPAQSNTVFYAEGTGVAYGNPSSGAGMTWNTISAGIEELVTDWAVSPPGGNPLIAFFDRPVFTISDPTKFPTDYGPTYTTIPMEGFSVDYSFSTPSYVAVMSQSNFDDSDTTTSSSNGGGTTGAPANWNAQFANFNLISDLHVNGGSYHGGSIAVSSPTCVALVVGNNPPGATIAASGLWTFNGTTWASPTITGITPGVTDNTGWSVGSSFKRQILAADRAQANTLYAYNFGSVTATAGLYRTTNCSSWSKVNVTAMPFTNSTVNTQMRTVPGVAGNLFLTSGNSSPDTPLNPFYQSTDFGVNFNAVSGVTDVTSFGFGKAKPGESVAAIYLYGRVGTVMGLWKGTNNFSTWIQLDPSHGAFPGDIIDAVTVVEGDMNTYGRVYICHQGSGCHWGTYP